MILQRRTSLGRAVIAEQLPRDTVQQAEATLVRQAGRRLLGQPGHQLLPPRYWLNHARARRGASFAPCPWRSGAGHQRPGPPEGACARTAPRPRTQTGPLRRARRPPRTRRRVSQVGGLAADDAMKTCGIDHGDVSGTQPAVHGPGRGGRLGTVQIAVEQRRRAQLQLTDASPVGGHLHAVLVPQSGVHAGQRLAHPPRSALPVGAGTQGDQGLAHPVALHRGQAGERTQGVEHAHGQRGATGHQQAGSGQGAGAACVGSQPAPHRRHPEVHAATRRGIGS